MALIVSVLLKSYTYLFVREVDVDGRFGLVAPHALVEGLQEGALQHGQGALHLAPAQPQGLPTAPRVAEAQRAQLFHLRHHRNTP